MQSESYTVQHNDADVEISPFSCKFFIEDESSEREFSSSNNFRSYFDSDHEDEEISAFDKVEEINDVEASNMTGWRDARSEGISSFTSTSSEYGGSVVEMSVTEFPNSESKTQAHQIKEGSANINTQLDFIFSSIKRAKGYDDNSLTMQYPQRTKKSKQQIEVLQKELGGLQTINKQMIKAAAEKTGLKKIQVYKWYWDFQKRMKNHQQVLSLLL